jgi:predicted O-linked N-acetylglucosamine transferase (SPINDLY family)
MHGLMLIPQQGAEPADEWIRLAIEAQTAGRFDVAERHYNQALRLDPRNVVATNNYAILHVQKGNLNEGLLAIDRAIIFDEKYGALHMNRGLMCMLADRIDEALLSARRACEIKSNKETRFALAMVLGTAGHPTETLPLYNAILDEMPEHPAAGPNACFAQTLTFATPADLLRQRRRYYDGLKVNGHKRPHRIDTAWPRPLRVGYVGGDFKHHSASMIFANVLLHHDKTKVLPFFYSSLPVDENIDQLTKKFKAAAEDRWRDIVGKTDDEAEEMVRADRIDILVDLAAHTNGGRLPLFTRKPAPIQVTAWGFAHGTGLPEMDWFLADPVSIPESERGDFAEKIYDLPSVLTYWEPPYELPESGDIPYRGNGFITFGSCSRYEKLSAECLKVYAEILRRIPDAVLRLKDSAYKRPYAIRRVTELMTDIDPKRLHFLIGTDHPEHMKSYRAADIALDPFPHGGGIVALEQLYMGLPIITLYGTQPSGRNTSSVLTAMGRTDWIAKTPEEYVEKAVTLANDLKTLREARKTLREELLKSPVCAGYAERVEAAYQEIWERDVLK